MSEIYGGKLLKEIHIVWGAEDVKSVAKGMGYKLTKAEISNVLYEMERKHDATIGITWETIEFFVEEIVRERKK